MFVDLVLYVFLAFQLLNYEDSYNKSKGAFYSLSSMTDTEKLSYIGFKIWIVLNFALILYLASRLIKIAHEELGPPKE